MTPTEAQAALKRQLVFGDTEQIQAIAIMEQIEQVVRLILKCEHDYDNQRKLCGCLTGLNPRLVEAATRDARLSGPHLASWDRKKAESIRNCLP